MVSDTNRMAHILTANKVKYMGVDVGTDPKARKIWRWKAKGRQLPAIVREGEVMCDLKQLEDWCEYREVWDRLVEDDVLGLTFSAICLIFVSSIFYFIFLIHYFAFSYSFYSVI